jgi:hypothetical protein
MAPAAGAKKQKKKWSKGKGKSYIYHYPLRRQDRASDHTTKRLMLGDSKMGVEKTISTRVSKELRDDKNSR